MNFRLTTMPWSIYIYVGPKQYRCGGTSSCRESGFPKMQQVQQLFCNPSLMNATRIASVENSPKKYDSLIHNASKLMDIIGNAPRNFLQSIAVLVNIQVCSIDQNKCFKIQNLSVSLVFKSVLCSFEYSKCSSPFPPWSSNFKKVGPSSMSLFMENLRVTPPHNTTRKNRRT